jgi:hypothetical protein
MTAWPYDGGLLVWAAAGSVRASEPVAVSSPENMEAEVLAYGKQVEIVVGGGGFDLLEVRVDLAQSLNQTALTQRPSRRPRWSGSTAGPYWRARG